MSRFYPLQGGVKSSLQLVPPPCAIKWKVNMARHKKIKTVHIEEKTEVPMTDEQELESLQTELDLARSELQKTKLEIEENKQQIQQVNARRELDEQEKSLVAKQISRTDAKDAVREKIEAQRVYDSEMVTGRFINRRSPGKKEEKLTYHKHGTDPVKWYPFADGQVYTIPRGFADQINGGTPSDPHYYTPGFNQAQPEMDPNKPNSAIHTVDTSNKKYAFVPLGFG